MPVMKSDTVTSIIINQTIHLCLEEDFFFCIQYGFILYSHLQLSMEFIINFTIEFVFIIYLNFIYKFLHYFRFLFIRKFVII